MAQKFRIVFVMVVVLLLGGCGLVDNGWFEIKCINGTTYLLDKAPLSKRTRGMTTILDEDGKPLQCSPNDVTVFP